ncbi:transcriptional repressor [Tropicibacter naphthalenivorans]|uniref:Zinc uptake regulation protein n=1 Tax=Tropicibacter naphthalenivorans TaxID=441103 RepID=A0A0N7LYU4_9RHOB|nr:transcriptional repressor [Tropicibacter naphthalenivorans]CUH75833.1 Zinc uptake regulation protein [Tropicibacter naphthalenivorans]SMC41927.1 Fur family transcriptional regulator, zinc uptake regulator [Tropicibacter naphthalenivorans]
MDPVGFETHDHAHCMASALAKAEEECAEKGLQLTPVRRRVLEILLEQHRALGAYDVLEHLRAEKLGSQPPVAYRALDFLVSHGFAHRIERLNAFIACSHPGERHAPCFLICRECSAVVEAPGRQAAQALREAAAQLGFGVERVAIEAEGLCPACGPAA